VLRGSYTGPKRENTPGRATICPRWGGGHRSIRWWTTSPRGARTPTPTTIRSASPTHWGAGSDESIGGGRRRLHERRAGLVSSERPGGRLPDRVEGVGRELESSIQFGAVGEVPVGDGAEPVDDVRLAGAGRERRGRERLAGALVHDDPSRAWSSLELGAVWVRNGGWKLLGLGTGNGPCRRMENRVSSAQPPVESSRF